MAVNISNFDVGAAQITLGGTDLGGVRGVTLTVETEVVDMGVDQYGNSLLDQATSSERVSVEIGIAEHDIDRFKDAIPAATKENAKLVTVGRTASHRLEQYAKELIIHPLSQGTSKDRDITIYKAISNGSFELSYSPEEQRIFTVTFHGLIDLTKDDGNLLFAIGDTSYTP
jgi:hypothetical protein